MYYAIYIFNIIILYTIYYEFSRALINGISAFIKEAPERFFAPSMWGYSQKMAINKKLVSSDMHCDLGLSSFQLCEK